MATTFTPSATDTGGVVVSLQTLALGAVVSGTLDLRAKPGAWVACCVGRGGTTALTTGVKVLIRRKFNNSVIAVPTPPMFVGDVTAAIRPTSAASGNNAATTSMTTAASSFAADDLCFIDDTGNVGLANSEWARVAKATSSTVSLLDKNGGLEFAHNSTSAHMSNHADIWPPVWCDAGAVWEVIFDYGQSTTGESVAVRALYQSIDSWQGV